MRRWVLIILRLVYPFQIALAVAHKCCVTTPAGMTHHSADQRPGATTAEPLCFFIGMLSKGARSNVITV